MKRMLVLVALLAVVSGAQAANMFWVGDYVNGNASADWSTVDSWWDGAADLHVPVASDTALLDSVITGIAVSHMPTVSTSIAGNPDLIFVAWASASAQMNVVDGGWLSAGHTRLGNAIDSVGTLNMTGGYMVSGILEVGYNLIHDAGDGNGPQAVAGGDGVVSMSGNSILHIGTLVFGQENIHYDAGNPLLDGEGAITMADSAWLLVNGDLVADGRAASYVANGWISALDSGQSIDFIYNATDSRTEFTVVPEPMTMAILGLGGLFVSRRRRS